MLSRDDNTARFGDRCEFLRHLDDEHTTVHGGIDGGEVSLLRHAQRTGGVLGYTLHTMPATGGIRVLR